MYGAVRVRDGQELTRCALSRNSKGYIALLADIEAANPSGDIFVITDNLSSHNSAQTRAFSIFSFPKAHAGSICKKAGGGSSGAMPSPVRVLRMLKRSSKRRVWLQPNLIGEPNRGCGDDRPRPAASCIVSFVIAFKE